MTSYAATARRYLRRANQRGMGGALARGSTIAFVVFSLGHLVNFVTQVVLARTMGRAEYGTFAWVSSWGVLLTVVAGIGLDTTALRMIPTYRTREQWGLLHGFLTYAGRLTVAISVALAATISLAILLASGFAPSERMTVLAVGVWIVPASAMLDLQTSVARAMRRLLLAYTPTRVLRYLALLVVVGGLWAADVRVDALRATIVALVSLALIVLVQGLLIRRRTDERVAAAPPERVSRDWLTIALPLLGIALTQSIMQRTDVLMIGSLMSPADVGVYNVATRVASMVTFVLAAVNAMAAPMIAQYHAAGDRARLQQLVTLVAHITFWPSLAIAAAMALFAVPLLDLFGAGFSEGRVSLLALLAGQVINAGAGSVGYILNMTGRERDSLRVYATSAVFNVIAVFVGIRLAGIEGAAVATGLTIVLWNVWLHQLAVRNLGIYPSVLSLVWRRHGEPRTGADD